MGIPKDPVKREEWRRKQSESHKNLHTMSDEGRARQAEYMRVRRQDPEYMQKLMDSIKNREMTDEYRQKLQHAAKERTFSDEARQKALQSRREHGVSEATRKKMSLSHLGNTYGSQISLESRQRTSERNKANPPRKGTSFTAEQKRMLSEMRSSGPVNDKLRAGTQAFWNRMSEEERSAHIQNALARSSLSPSSLEIVVSERLTSLGILHERQYKIWRYAVDIYIPSRNLIIEVNGCYWHKCPECGYNNPPRWAKEEKRTQKLQSLGYTVAVLWEHSIIRNVIEAVDTVLQVGEVK